MVIKDVVELGVRELNQNKEIESPLKEARLILAEVIYKSKEYIMGFPDEEVTTSDFDKFCSLIGKRKNNMPIQYVLGHTEFMKLNFNVNENVLVPRADTEILVEEVLKEYKDSENVEILDLCTRKWSNWNITCKIYRKFCCIC